ncbi:MAG TPA: FKBP-type peptidyl-prolyl cis-trans isomerase [Pyrinomonadaceae bacterium]
MKLTLVVCFISPLLFLSAASAQRRGARTPRRAPVAKPRPAATPAKAEPTPSAAGVTTPTGLTYIVTHRGSGRTPAAGEEVAVHYTGLLTDGTVFDSSRNCGAPITFRLGEGRVIKGWDEAVARLRVGDRATLIIPPQLGYGDRGAGGVIPPGATLIFVVELVSAGGGQPPAGAEKPPQP